MIATCTSCGHTFDSELRKFKYVKEQKYYLQCPSCRAERSRYNKEHREEIRKKRLITYKARKQNGICAICGSKVDRFSIVCSKCSKNNKTVFSKLHISEHRLNALTVGEELFRKPDQSIRKVEERYGIILSCQPIISEIIREDNIITIKCDEISFYVNLQKPRKHDKKYTIYALYVLGKE